MSEHAERRMLGTVHELDPETRKAWEEADRRARVRLAIGRCAFAVGLLIALTVWRCA